MEAGLPDANVIKVTHFADLIRQDERSKLLSRAGRVEPTVDTVMALQVELDSTTLDRDEWRHATLEANQNASEEEARRHKMQEERDGALERVRVLEQVPPPLSYAGIRVWAGDARVERALSQYDILKEVYPRLILSQVAQQCVECLPLPSVLDKVK